MWNNSTFSIQSTCTRTWVNALLILACFVWRAIAIDNTLRTTCWWATYVVRKAWANGLIVYFPTLGITATRWRVTTVILFVLNDWSALNECVSFCTTWTSARREMIVYITLCSWCTSCTLAWINAMIPNTRLISWAFAIQNTFWSALCVWVALQPSWASTHSIITQSIWSAGRWITFITRSFVFN